MTMKLLFAVMLIISIAFVSFSFAGRSDLGGKMMNMFKVNTLDPSFIYTPTAPQRLIHNAYI